MLTTFASLACPGHELWGGRYHVAAELDDSSAAPDWSCSHIQTLKGFLSRKAKVGSGWTWGKLIPLQAALPWCAWPGGRCGEAVDVPSWLVHNPLSCQASPLCLS